jgi:hypothetical protein
VLPLTERDELALTRGLLKQLQWRLLDKDSALLPASGKYYSKKIPHNCSAIGSIAQRPEKAELESGIPLVPNNMGLAFLVSAPVSGPLIIEVDGRFDLEHAYIPDYQEQVEALVRDAGVLRPEQYLAPAYQRYSVQFAPARFEVPLEHLSKSRFFAPVNNTLKEALREHQAQVSADPRVYRRLLPQYASRPRQQLRWSQDIVDQDSLTRAVHAQLFEARTDPLPYTLELQCRVRPAPQKMRTDAARTQYLVEVILVNKTTRAVAECYQLYDHRVMDVNLKVRIVTGTHQQMRRQLPPEEYRYAPVQFVDGHGFTCALVREADGTLRTESLPTYEQPLTEEPTPEELGMRAGPEFALLAREPLPILDDFLAAKRLYAEQWTQVVEQLEAERAPTAKAARSDLQDFLYEVQRVAAGIALLRAEPKLLRAFCLTNEAALDAMRVQDTGITRWYLFQLGFVLTQIPELARRIEGLEPGVDALLELLPASLLRAPSGKGKTEAFVLFILLTMFTHRLIGREFGTDAWVRTPLRIVSIQQNERVNFMVAAAERLRVREGLGGHPFTVGYFTGKGTPNQISSQKEYAKDNFAPTLADDKDAAERLRYLDKCPHCTQRVQVQVHPQNFTIKHVCSSATCWSNRKVSKERAPFEYSGHVGFYITDEECYRYLPTVLLGTVDKIVVLAHNRNFRNFFGAVTHYCPTHGFIRDSTCNHFTIDKTGEQWNEPKPCENDRSSRECTFAVTQKYPGIAILVGDEIHLQKESFGSFTSHFISLFEALQCAYPGGRLPIVIGATATIRDYRKHMHHLHARHTNCFPARGMALDSSFYSRVRLDPQTGLPLARRIFVGAQPANTQDNLVAEWICDAQQYYQEVLTDTQRLLAQAPAEVCAALGLDVRQAAALQAHIQNMLLPVVVYTRRDSDTEYVEQRFKADNERLASAGKTPRVYERLEGKTPLPKLQKVIAKIQANDPNDRIDQIVTTPLFSHGLHMPNISMLATVGVPTSVAEYGQISSRCARSHAGIVLVGCSPYNLFESKIFTHFTDHHRFLDRSVESVPINRLARRVFDHTLPGMLKGLLLNAPPSAPWRRNIGTKALRLSSVLMQPGVSEALLAMIVRAYGLERVKQLKVFNTLQLRETEQYTLQKAQRLIEQMRDVQPRYATESVDVAMVGMYGRRAQISLRNIEPEVELLATNSDSRRMLRGLGLDLPDDADPQRQNPHVPFWRAFYEFLPGAVAALDGGVFAQVVGTNNNAERAQLVDASLACDVVMEDFARFKANGGAIEKTLYEQVLTREAVIITPTQLFIEPYPVRPECTNPSCGYSEPRGGKHYKARIKELAQRLRKPGERLLCEKCQAPQKQLPYVQIHRCGRLGEFAVPRGAEAAALRYIDGATPHDGRWECFGTHENLGYGTQGKCPLCVREHGTGPHTSMVGVKLRSGRSPTFYSRLLQFIALTRETSQMLTAFRAASADPAELGRAIVCALFGLQTPEALRHNLDAATHVSAGPLKPAELAREHRKLQVKLENLRGLPGLEDMVRELEGDLRKINDQLQQASNLFNAAHHYIDDPAQLAEIGGFQRAAEAALLRREFHERSLDQDIVSAQPAQQMLLDDTRNTLLCSYGVREVRYIEDLGLVVACAGFTRQAAEPRGEDEVPLLLNGFHDERNPALAGKIPIYALPMYTEAISLRLDPCRLLQWCVDNLQWSLPPPEVMADANAAHSFILKRMPALYGGPDHIEQLALRNADNGAARVLGVLHSFGHTMLRNARSISGYDLLNLGEYYLPIDFSVLIHVNAREDFTTAGMQTLYLHGLQTWFDQAATDSFSCMLDPSCSEHNCACGSCLQLPLGCQTYNRGVTRAYLHGGVIRDHNNQEFVVQRGFWS